MQVAAWGNRPAVRLPRSDVEALDCRLAVVHRRAKRLPERLLLA